MVRNKKKYNYFEKRNLILEQDGIQTRLELGFREINTLKKILSLYQPHKKINFKNKLRILDAGCGDKFLKTPITDQNWAYKGLDVKDVDFEKKRLPFKTKSFDIFISLAVIEHLKDPSIFLNEAYRTIKSGGLIYISTSNFFFDYKNFYNDPTHNKPYTPKSLELLLEMHGFTNIKTYPGLRCKPSWFYKGKLRFYKAYYLFPFKNENKWAPKFLKGHSRSFFAIAQKEAKY